MTTPKKEIGTVAGTATYVCTLTDKELDAGDYSTRNGYWVIHHADTHDIYKVYPKSTKLHVDNDEGWEVLV